MACDVEDLQDHLASDRALEVEIRLAACRIGREGKQRPAPQPLASMRQHVYGHALRRQDEKAVVACGAVDAIAGRKLCFNIGSSMTESDQVNERELMASRAETIMLVSKTAEDREALEWSESWNPGVLGRRSESATDSPNLASGAGDSNDSNAGSRAKD